MVRVYKRKTDRATQYSKEDLQAAVREVSAGRLTVYAASRHYSIPASTISNHKRGVRGRISKTLGRSTALSANDETKLAECLSSMEKWGFGLTRKELLDLVQNFVKRNNLKTCFKNGRPGEDWFLGFKQRHRLSLKKPQAVEFARKKAVDPFPINEYFDLLEQLIIEHKFEEKPYLIYNLDESSFCLDPTKSKIVGKVNTPSSRTTSGPAKENITVLVAGSATGHKLPPMIIFKAKYLWDEWLAPENVAFPKTAYAATKNGWMEADVFLRYMEKTFIPSVPDERPILLIYDGHSTHVDERTIRLAIDNNIIILKLPPHSSHLLQPLDLAVFKAMKDAWDAKLVSWQRKHIGQKLSKKTFSQFIGEIWTGVNEANLINGFRKAGIHPFNRLVISREKYDLEALRRWDNKQNSVFIENIQNTQTVLNVPDIEAPSTSGISRRTNDTNEHNDLKSNSFESLMLQEIKQKQRDEKKTKKRVIGAEVITSREVLEKIMTNNKKGQKPEQKPKRPTINRKTKPVKAKNPESSEESDVLEMESFAGSDSDDETLEELKKRYERKEKETEEEERVISLQANIKVGTWVLVEFATKKTKKYFVGQILELVDDEIKVKFLRKKEDTVKPIFYWPEVEDESVVSENAIIMPLPEPILGRRGEVIFSVEFSTYNVL